MTETIELPETYNEYKRHLPDFSVAVERIFAQLTTMYRELEEGTVSHVYQLMKQDTLRSIVGNYLLSDSIKNNSCPIEGIHADLYAAKDEFEDNPEGVEICLVELAQEEFYDVQEELTEYIGCLELRA